MNKRVKTSKNTKKPINKISNKTIIVLIVLVITLTATLTIGILNLEPENSYKYSTGGSATIKLNVPETTTPNKETQTPLNNE